MDVFFTPFFFNINKLKYTNGELKIFKFVNEHYNLQQPLIYNSKLKGKKENVD
jgi:hypothetical protein